MRLAIMQPYFFPYIGYFQLIHSVDKFMLYENVTFRVRSWMTRNYILPKNGEPFLITLPLYKRSSYKTVNEIELAVDTNWRRNLCKTIYYAYKKAAFFEETFPVIEKIILFNGCSLSEYNSNLITEICHHLGIETEISTNHSSYIEMEKKLTEWGNIKFNKYYEEKFDNLLEKKHMRIIEICKNENMTTYHNPIGGRELYSKETFAKYDIALNFIDTKEIIYNQFHPTFTPNLSIIDVLMHCGISETQNLLKEYTLI